MFIKSKCVQVGSIMVPQFSIDFPDYGFVVSPETQDMSPGREVVLEILPPDPFDMTIACDLTPSQRETVLQKYQEVR